MKFRPRLLALVCVAAIMITSCKKNVNEKEEQRNSLGLVTSSGNNCRSIGFGLATRENNGTTSWKNLFLKWYDGSGQIRNVKIHMGFEGGIGQQEEFSMDYGEVTRIADELRIRDVFYNQEVLKVKLDNMERPLISWFNSFGRGAPTFQYDTSYYFYSPENRLSSIVSHRKTAFGLSGATAADFIYDPVGNLVQINESGGGSMEFRYDYTQLNRGMVTLHMLSGPVKALEFLDLLSFNHYHRVTGVVWYAPGGYPFWGWGYGNFQINESGQVISYTQNTTDRVPTHTWYTAWDCGDSNMIQSKNPSQEEFMRLLR